MLEMLQLYNTWAWNIIGFIVSVPILVGGTISAIMGLVGAIIALFTFRKTNVN